MIFRVLPFAVAAIALFTGRPALAWGVKVGKPAPDFHATMFDGHQVSLADFKGRVLVINLWATWCGPCKVELPLLDVYYKMRKDVGLSVLAVATEDSIPEDALKKLSEKISLPMARNLRGSYHQLDGVPTNYIVDRAGVVRYAKAGALTLDAMNTVFIPLLKEQAPATAVPPSPPTSAQETPSATVASKLQTH